MPISFIFSAIFYNNQFAIGKDNDLIVKIPDDLKFFKYITHNNIVIMGRKTWDSIGQKALPNRTNIIVTNTPKKYTLTENAQFMTSETVLKYVNKIKGKNNIFIIGGSQIFKLFTPFKMYITHIQPIDKTVYQDADVYVNIPDKRYQLVGYSPLYKYDGGQYRHLIYQYRYVVPNFDSIDEKYINLCQDVLNKGEYKNDRTGTGTTSCFGKQLSFNLQHGFPLLTTKTIPWKHVVEELLWFMRGDTDSKILEEKNIKIWTGNTSREFLDSQGLNHYREGILGKGYGWQWRFFGAEYSEEFADTTIATPTDGFDQLQYVINEIKTNPDSRRILMCYWNSNDLNKTALPPCHYSCQFYVRQKKYLDCLFNMRSTDVALGLPFNIASYATLVHILAKKCDLEPGMLVYNGGDVHIYKTHVESIKTQFSRVIYSAPRLILSDTIRDKNVEDITIDDFALVGYFSHPSIKMKMAV